MLSLLLWRDGGLRFGVIERDGAMSGGGRFPDQAPSIDEIVVADFSLLADPELFAPNSELSIGLLPPRRQGASLSSPAAALLLTDRGVDPQRLAHRWVGLPRSKKAFARLIDIERLEPMLELRRTVHAALRQEATQLHRFLTRAFPKYAAALAPTGQLDGEALAFLRVYPTPDRIHHSSSFLLRKRLEQIFSSTNWPAAQAILEYQQRSNEAEAPVAQQIFALRRITGDLEAIELRLHQIHEIDQSVHELVLTRFQPGSSHETTPQEGFSVLDVPAHSTPTDAVIAPGTLPEIFEQLEALARKAASDSREPKLDLESFKLLGIAAGTSLGDHHAPSPLGPPEAATSPGTVTRSWDIKIGVLGQRLALAANDFPGAARYQAMTQRVLAQTGQDELEVRDVLDAELTSAITGLLTTNVPTGFGEMRQLLQDPRVSNADPRLVAEARGLMMVVLLLYGESKELVSLVTREAHRRDQEVSFTGAARAGVAITELFLVGTHPETRPETLEALIKVADESSDRTSYRPFFNFIMMMLSYVTRDRDAAMHGYAELQQDQLWERYTPSLSAQVQLAYAFHLASAGRFAAARRHVKEIREPGDYEGAATFAVQRDLFELYLDAAAGDYVSILAATEPDRRLGEQRLAGSEAERRFLPAALLLRGTALVRSGTVARGEALFRQATLTAINSHAWVVLLCGETAEYRAWLSALDPTDLPVGLSAEARARILERPLFFSHELPSITPQQTRILRALALGYSSAAIANDLHITSNTLKTHLRRLYARLGVNNRVEAVLQAEGYGLID